MEKNILELKNKFVMLDASQKLPENKALETFFVQAHFSRAKQDKIIASLKCFFIDQATVAIDSTVSFEDEYLVDSSELKELRNKIFTVLDDVPLVDECIIQKKEECKNFIELALSIHSTKQQTPLLDEKVFASANLSCNQQSLIRSLVDDIYPREEYVGLKGGTGLESAFNQVSEIMQIIFPESDISLDDIKDNYYASIRRRDLV